MKNLSPINEDKDIINREYLSNNYLLNTTKYAGSSSIGGAANTAILFKGVDTRDTNETPQWYMSNKGSASIVTEFKGNGAIGVNTLFTGAYCELTTFTSWGDSSGGYPVQIATSSTNGGEVAIRTATSTTAWGTWQRIITSNTYATSTTAGAVKMGWDSNTKTLTISNV